MINICKIYAKTVKKSDKAILLDHCDKFFHMKCKSLDKVKNDMLKQNEDHDAVYVAIRKCYHFTVNILKLTKQIAHQ